MTVAFCRRRAVYFRWLVSRFSETILLKTIIILILPFFSCNYYFYYSVVLLFIKCRRRGDRNVNGSRPLRRAPDPVVRLYYVSVVTQRLKIVFVVDGRATQYKHSPAGVLF